MKNDCRHWCLVAGILSPDTVAPAASECKGAGRPMVRMDGRGMGRGTRGAAECEVQAHGHRTPVWRREDICQTSVSSARASSRRRESDFWTRKQGTATSGTKEGQKSCQQPREDNRLGELIFSHYCQRRRLDCTTSAPARLPEHGAASKEHRSEQNGSLAKGEMHKDEMWSVAADCRCSRH